MNHLCRKDAALWVSHVPPEVVQNPSRHLSKLGVLSQSKSVQIGAYQLWVVIQHLLKVGNVPMLIYAISVETPSYLVVHTTSSHLVKCESGHLQRLPCRKDPSVHVLSKLVYETMCLHPVRTTAYIVTQDTSSHLLQTEWCHLQRLPSRKDA